jgi:aldehyde dehydrogenase (NAD+)/aldehyde dehydrogenase
LSENILGQAMIGSQVLNCDKILNYINIGKEEGAVVLAGGGW